MRGTFANTRIKNQMVPGIEGGVTAYLPGGEVMPIYDAAMKYQAAGVPLIVIAGKEYGSGSSRDWAAKGTMLLGVKAVIAESYERIHRSNLVNMGVLPLQFKAGETSVTLVPDRPRSVRVDRRRSGAEAAGRGHGARARGGRHHHDVHRHRPHRYARGAGRLLARRHPAVRASSAGEEVDGNDSRRDVRRVGT